MWLQDSITPVNFETIISADIFNTELDLLLYDVVWSIMIHVLRRNLNRNSPYMLNGTCSKQYSRPLSKNRHTVDYILNNGRLFPSDKGFTVEIME